MFNLPYRRTTTMTVSVVIREASSSLVTSSRTTPTSPMNRISCECAPPIWGRERSSRPITHSSTPILSFIHHFSMLDCRVATRESCNRYSGVENAAYLHYMRNATIYFGPGCNMGKYKPSVSWIIPRRRNAGDRSSGSALERAHHRPYEWRRRVGWSKRIPITRIGRVDFGIRNGSSNVHLPSTKQLETGKNFHFLVNFNQFCRTDRHCAPYERPWASLRSRSHQHLQREGNQGIIRSTYFPDTVDYGRLEITVDGQLLNYDTARHIPWRKRSNISYEQPNTGTTQQKHYIYHVDKRCVRSGSLRVCWSNYLKWYTGRNRI